MKIGDKQIPENRLPSLIEATKTLYGKFSSKEVDDEITSRLLGHTTAKSGAYIQKKADMRSFGLIEARGAIKVTELGRRITYPNNAKEEQDGLIEAVSNIPLWKEIYAKYTMSNAPIPADFWTDIRVWTGIPPEEAKNMAEIVRKDYLEDIKYIKPVNEPEKKGDTVEPDKINTSEAISEGVVGRVILSGSGHIDVKDEATYTLAEAYLKVFADKLGLKKKAEEKN